MVRARRASDFVEDKDVAAHNEKISKLPKGKDGKVKQVRATSTNSKGKKTSKKIVPSGKFSKEGQKKVETANARNAGRNIMGTAGGSNTDSFGTQARGAKAKPKGLSGKKTIKSLELIQTNLTDLLQVVKTEARLTKQIEIFKSLDDSMDQLRKDFNA